MTGLRVVQWATGNIGTRSLREIIEHPDLTLAGVYVTSAAKAGRDAGELCGLPPTGVTATSDAGEILALGADCVLYMPAACDLDQVCDILASGTNIVTTRGEFHHPGSMQPDMLFNLMGFGHPVHEFPPERFSFGAYSFGPSMRLVAEAVGLPLDSVTATGEVAVTPEKLTIAAGTLDAGTVAGQRTIVTGMHAGRPLVTFTATWYCTEALHPAWTVPGWDGWQVRVDGDAPLDVDIRFAIPAGRMGEMTPGYTSNRAVNAVPYVCAAPPGIRTTVDLPQIIPALG